MLQQMKITADAHHPTILFPKSQKPTSPDSPDSPDSDPVEKLKNPLRRKPKNPTFGVRLKREGRRSRPETPLLHWKVDAGEKSVKKSGRVPVSVRKIAAGLWRLHLPEVPTDAGEWCSFPRKERVGSQSATCHVGFPVLAHQAKDPIQSPHSVSGNEVVCKHVPSFNFSNSAMEGATKWDPMCGKGSEEVERIYNRSKKLGNKVGVASAVSELEVELKQARTRIHELEAEQQSSKKKLEHFLKRLSDERAMWRSREHEKIRAIIDDMKAELHREKKARQRAELVNSKLVNELADSKLSAKRFMQDYEKERKARELVEEVCDELAKEIGEDKAEVEAIKRESLKLREEFDDERKMLQMAEVWREERVQMKLVDAKVMLEERYSQMNKLVADMKGFLSSNGGDVNVEEMKKAENLLQAATSMSIQDIKDFTYEPAHPDDFFAVFEDVNFGQPNEREAEANTGSPEINHGNREDTQGNSSKFVRQSRNEDTDDDESGWETMSNPDEHGSSFSPDGSKFSKFSSNRSVNEIRHVSNVSDSGIEWEENTGEEIGEVYVVPNEQLKKSSSISRIWRSCPRKGERYKIISVDGANRVISNGRLSTGGIISPDRGSGKDGVVPRDLGGQWSSPELGNPHITRGMKGCIEWPRGVQKNSLKSKLLEARMESQKIQIRHVLKQKI